MNADSELIREWIDKADHDLGSAKLIFLHIPEYFDTIAFHCQQATEKYLKAMLVYSGIDFQRTHNLVFLLDLLSQKMALSEDTYDKAILLNGFSVQIRYPNKNVYLTKEELELSINIAQEFRNLALQMIGIEE